MCHGEIYAVLGCEAVVVNYDLTASVQGQAVADHRVENIVMYGRITAAVLYNQFGVVEIIVADIVVHRIFGVDNGHSGECIALDHGTGSLVKE